ncbi:MAG: HD domain-containing protein [Thermoguttaceae bacterium]|nr:HD domain-containing protein [Thermoguttaceae bacterium]
MFQEDYKSETLAQDSVHGYIALASPGSERLPDETVGERDLVDSPWIQRLRQIHQLQTAWFVYPTAEHSRFQHVLGAAQVASKVWEQLRDGFYRVFDENPGLIEGGATEAARRPVPSQYCVESLLRTAALLHDVGHGPFGHFFDDNFLARHQTPSGDRLTHETLGAAIVRERLADVISGIRRSPGGTFEPGEKLDPDDVAYLIVRPKPRANDADKPAWLRMLRSLFSGLYTVDNIDFVMRDAYSTGYSAKPFDLERLLHYSFFTPSGLTIHKKGAATLRRFLNVRAELFQSVYFHRTVRAIDVELVDLFQKSADLLYPYGNPLDSLDEYLRFTDWSLISDVSSWDRSPYLQKRELASDWKDFIARKIKWRALAEKTILFREGDGEDASVFASAELFRAAMFAKLSPAARELPLRFDVARHAIRPDSALTRNFLYDPETDQVIPFTSDPLLRTAPKSFRVCRVYGRSSEGREEIVEAFNKLASSAGVDDLTNV